MAFIRFAILTIASLLYINAGAQTIYYPAGASQLLQQTAADMAGLLQRAIPGSTPTLNTYTTQPSNGIVLVYDSSIAHNLSCRIQGNGSTYLQFAAAQDNGLVYGIYHYLRQLGFSFYQPGTLWEVIPNLTTAFTTINTTITGKYKYNTWFISGGHNRWVMDNTTQYGWDIYYGNNGHQWALYQRRNGMGGAYRFAGHRTDILSNGYLAAMQANPCFVACYEGSRAASYRSVPDVNNSAAVQQWGTAIKQKFTQYKNTIQGNPVLYANQFRNFTYNNQLIGLEVPDGAQWGNSSDASCGNTNYGSESDQQFTLANASIAATANIGAAGYQCYAYSSHADVPASTIAISNKLDVQVIPTAFQAESSAKGLLNRWYARHNNISEYHYLNLPQWGGETPMQYQKDLQQTLTRLKEKNSQGISWEASPAKFASLPYLLAASNQLQYEVAVDSTINRFARAMFGPAAGTIQKLLQYWADDKTITQGDYIPDNRYKLPLYLQLVQQAATQANTPAIQQRIAELKAYLHYMVLYYDWLFDQRSNTAKESKAAAVCLYLASVHHLQLVNSYFLIADITSRYAATSNFHQQYNVANGTAYQNGTLPLITTATIEANFAADIAVLGNLVKEYQLLPAATVQQKIASSNIEVAKTISVKIGYTNGYNYTNRSEYSIIAPSAGQISIAYTPRFDMPGKGQINFTVESMDNALEIIKDVTVKNGAGAGTITVSLPRAGAYKLSITTKFKTAVDVSITTNGNSFYKGAAFIGNKVENYRANLLHLPGYFYVPEGITKIYFSINNSNPGGTGFATPDAINKAFVFKDNNNTTVKAALVTPNDSALFYISVPAGSSGSFWQVTKMEQYHLCFTNIANNTWYARRKPCGGAAFSVVLSNTAGTCITTLKAAANTTAPRWEIYDAGRWDYYSTAVVTLPETISPNAIVTLHTATGCSQTLRLGDDEKYMRQREACASGAPIPADNAKEFALQPNPSTGIFNCMQQGLPVRFDELILLDGKGQPIGRYNQLSQINISNQPAGIYFYQCRVGDRLYKGRLVKL